MLKMRVHSTVTITLITILLLVIIGCFVFTRPQTDSQFAQRPPPAIIYPSISESRFSSCPTGRGILPDSNTLPTLDQPTLLRLYRDYTNNIEVVCNVMLRMGVLGDGGWEICHDEYVRPKENNCLVYSFGIANDFSFDDMTGQIYKCEIHSFDPSMKSADTKRSDKVMFHHLGIFGSNGKIHGGWPVKTLAEIKKTLGHENRQIDVLKMDIEHSEWNTLPTAINDGSMRNVTQFLFEAHNTDHSKASLLNKLKLLKRVRDSGFRTFYSHKNPVCGMGHTVPKITACNEIHMIRFPACEING